MAGKKSISNQVSSSRFNIINGQIAKYRDRQAEAAKKSEKDNAQRMKEMERQAKQQAGSLSPQEQMRQNFNNFARSYTSNPAAIPAPTVAVKSPMDNIGQNASKTASFCDTVKKQLQVIEKYANIKKKNIGLFKYALSPDYDAHKKVTDAQIALSDAAGGNFVDRDAISSEAFRRYLGPAADSFLNRYGYTLADIGLDLLGIRRKDDKADKGKLINPNASGERFGDLSLFDYAMAHRNYYNNYRSSYYRPSYYRGMGRWSRIFR